MSVLSGGCCCLLYLFMSVLLFCNLFGCHRVRGQPTGLHACVILLCKYFLLNGTQYSFLASVLGAVPFCVFLFSSVLYCSVLFCSVMFCPDTGHTFLRFLMLHLERGLFIWV